MGAMSIDAAEGGLAARAAAVRVGSGGMAGAWSQIVGRCATRNLGPRY